MLKLFVYVFILTLVAAAGPPSSPPVVPTQGAYETGKWRNMFEEYGYAATDIQAKVSAAFEQLFYGDNSTQALFFSSSNPPNSGYIYSVDSDDVRSEGMSYGMMITVQLDKQKEFDMIFSWVKANMQHTNTSDARYGYAAWHCKPTGDKIDVNPASDGETWFVTALIFAHNKWGSTGRFDYQAEANLILSAMLSKEEGKIQESVVNMFNSQHQVVFTPYASAAKYTDASYHLPSFYQLWAEHAPQNTSFWTAAVQAARTYFHSATDPTTGLASDYSSFDGKPYGSGNTFHYDAWRVAQNIAMDYAWLAADDWQITHSNKILEFFAAQGISTYDNHYTPEGKNLGGGHSPGLVGMNCVATLASNSTAAWQFVEALWNQPVPTGKFRYYDGCLYMIGLLQCSGNFRVYK